MGRKPRGAVQKGRLRMSSQFTRTLVASVAAILLSTVAVGAAIGPVHAMSTQPLTTMIGANLNA